MAHRCRILRIDHSTSLSSFRRSHSEAESKHASIFRAIGQRGGFRVARLHHL